MVKQGSVWRTDLHSDSVPGFGNAYIWVQPERNSGNIPSGGKSGLW